MYEGTHTNIIQIELPSRMYAALIAFQKHDGHTNIQLPIPGLQSMIQCLALMHSAIKFTHTKLQC